MALCISRDLPYIGKLKRKGIDIVDHYDMIIALVNLMPNKEETEFQILRYIGKSKYSIKIDYIYMASHKQKSPINNHLERYYETFSYEKYYDGVIVTGAPVEKMPFEKVDYWREFTDIIDYCNDNIKSSLYICWAAQGALYYLYNIKKLLKDKKIFGVYRHDIMANSFLFHGLSEEFYMAHSRYSYPSINFENERDLSILDTSEVGPHIICSKDYRNVFFLGHGEYEKDTLKKEYLRDKEKGIDANIPKNYFLEDHIERGLKASWRKYGETLFVNWVNSLKN